MTTESRTPIEQAKAHVADIQNQIQALYREGHVLSEQAAVARQAGDNIELERLNQLIHENTVGYRTLGGVGGGRLEEARQALASAQQALRIAQRNALEAARGAQRYDREIAELEERLVSLKTQREQAQQAAQAAQDALNFLEPPVVSTPVLVAPNEPEPVVEAAPAVAPEFAPPTRTLSLRGEPTRYFRGDIETDRDGRPLAVQPEPSTSRKADPLAAQTRESLY